MTFLSPNKFSFITPIIALSVLTLASVFLSSTASANTCSKSDVNFYLQKGFTNDQVVQLCAGAVSQPKNQVAAINQAPAQTQQYQQPNALREDQSYLSAALDADGVTMNSQNLSFLTTECIEYSPGLGKYAVEQEETICVGTKLNINFSGLTIGRASRGLFLVKDATVFVKGNIQREFIGINELRRQDREVILSTLKTNPTELRIKIRRGIDPGAVANRLKKYVR